MTFEVSKKKDLQSIWFRGKIDLWFLFSLFANGPPIFIFYKVVGLLAVATGQKLQKKWTCINRERGEKFSKIENYYVF